MKKMLFCWLGVMLLALSACVSQVPGTANNPTPATKKLYKRHKAARVRVATHNQPNATYNVALSDFSDLNLPNDGQEKDNIWEKMAEGFKIPNPESHPEVQQQIHWFLTHPGYLQRTTERARPYMYIVYNEVKKRGLPTELVLLPINESGYYPFSYSTAGATGIWQLMPGTASSFGLKHNFWYDGRRDIFDSTNAALDYLTYLANYFNDDWLLAIAAYDSGEGTVQNAIARNQRQGLPTDFWSLHLPAETTAYVPRLLAIAAIIEHPDRYPVPLPTIEDKPVVAQVRLNKQLKLADVARLSGLSVNQVKVLNPGLSHAATDPSHDARVLLPIDNIDDFRQGLQNLPAVTPPPANSIPYIAKAGDTLPRLASRYRISLEALRQANPNIADRLVVGQELWVPQSSEDFAPQAAIDLNHADLKIQAASEKVVVNSVSSEIEKQSTKKAAMKKALPAAVKTNKTSSKTQSKSKNKTIKKVAKKIQTKSTGH